MKSFIKSFIVLCLIFCVVQVEAQKSKTPFFHPVDSFSKARFWGLTGTTAVGYTGVVTGLSKLWYANYPRSKFHLFNDLGEWKDMDKMGHLFTAYFQSKWAKQAYAWTGLSNKGSIWAGMTAGTLFQTTLEVLDGFSEEWGFSIGDVAFNTSGVLLMGGQEWLWDEQRIVLKLSSHRVKYPDALFNASMGNGMSSQKIRAAELYGTSLPEMFIKEYNGLTIWASVNIRSFIKKEKTWVPSWLNVAAGYGAENLFGGYNNSWEDSEGNIFVLDRDAYPRYRQYFLSFDIDFTRIKTKHRALQILFNLVNIIKIPAPALEYNSLGKFKFRPFYF